MPLPGSPQLSKASLEERKSAPLVCPGVTEVRPIAARLYGIRVQRHLVSKIKGLPGLRQAKSTSDLFCIEVSAMDNSPDCALRRFREIAAKAGLGPHFGLPSPEAGQETPYEPAAC